MTTSLSKSLSKLDWNHFSYICLGLVFVEALLNSLIIQSVPYTEIDWTAYMQECEGWISGELDYTKLKGDTGPLVYPAGFVYVFTLLRWLTGGGRGDFAIRRAQWIFMSIYLVTQYIVARIYNRAKPGPVWIILLLALSKRLHSLFVLRLFNDCVAMLFAYGFLAAFISRRWFIGTMLFSLALSIKMNILLFLPGFIFVLARNTGILRSVGYLVVIIISQAIIGMPFLLSFPQSYRERAFDFSRVCQYKWTVNLKFLPE
jgi:alpha-1,3-mannosyltransferase